MNNPLIKVSVKWGLIFTLVSSISLISTYLFGISTNLILGMVIGILSIVITVVLMVLANRDYRNTYLDGYIKYWQCF